MLWCTTHVTVPEQSFSWICCLKKPVHLLQYCCENLMCHRLCPFICHQDNSVVMTDDDKWWLSILHGCCQNSGGKTLKPHLLTSVLLWKGRKGVVCFLNRQLRMIFYVAVVLHRSQSLITPQVEDSSRGWMGAL